MTKKVMIVGSNPSTKSSNLSAFDTSTKSGRTVDEWLSPLGKYISEIIALNVYDRPTENNRSLTQKEIKAGCKTVERWVDYHKPDVVVAFGKTASKALTLLGIEHYEMPHPSGLNRQLNDPNHIVEKLKGLEALLQPTPSECASEN